MACAAAHLTSERATAAAAQLLWHAQTSTATQPGLASTIQAAHLQPANRRGAEQQPAAPALHSRPAAAWPAVHQAPPHPPPSSGAAAGRGPTRPSLPRPQALPNTCVRRCAAGAARGAPWRRRRCCCRPAAVLPPPLPPAAPEPVRACAPVAAAPMRAQRRRRTPGWLHSKHSDLEPRRELADHQGLRWRRDGRQWSGGRAPAPRLAGAGGRRDGRAGSTFRHGAWEA